MRCAPFAPPPPPLQGSGVVNKMMGLLNMGAHVVDMVSMGRCDDGLAPLPACQGHVSDQASLHGVPVRADWAVPQGLGTVAHEGRHGKVRQVWRDARRHCREGWPIPQGQGPTGRGGLQCPSLS